MHIQIIENEYVDLVDKSEANWGIDERVTLSLISVN
jgi:hypothetical protein